MKTLAATCLAFALTATAALADNLDRSVYIVNDGWTPIYSVHIANVDDPNWQRDLLGGYMLSAGYNTLVEPQMPQGYCKFDVRVEYEGEEVIQMNGVNLCQADAIITTEDGGYVQYMDGGTSNYIDANY